MKKPTDADQLAIEAVPWVNGTELVMPTEEERARQYADSAYLMNGFVYVYAFARGRSRGRG